VSAAREVPVAAQDILDQIDQLRDNDPPEYSKLIQLLQWRIARERADELSAQEAIGTFAEGLVLIDHEAEARDFVERCEELERDWPRDLDDDAVIVFRAVSLEQTLRNVARCSTQLANTLSRTEYDEQLGDD
jgi:hypothetical protein